MKVRIEQEGKYAHPDGNGRAMWCEVGDEVEYSNAAYAQELVEDGLATEVKSIVANAVEKITKVVSTEEPVKEPDSPPVEETEEEKQGETKRQPKGRRKR